MLSDFTLDAVRLIAAIALVAFATTGCIRARRIAVWHAGIVATEYGAWIGVFALLVAASRPVASVTGAVGLILSLIAAVQFLRPPVLAWRLARTNPALKDSFTWRRLFFAANARGPAPERHVYADHDGAPLALHLYRAPKPRPGAPVLLYFHSGGWDSGSPHEFGNWFHALVADGLTIAAAEYRLAPKFPWPAQRCDALDALAFLKNNRDALKLPSAKILLWGRSAGGHIALCTAYKNAGDPDVAGVATFYAPTDMFASWYHSYKGDMLDSHMLLTGFLGGLPRDTHANHRDASPARLAPPNAPPTLLIHGGRDEVVWCLQRRLLSNRLARVGAPVEFLMLPWAKHACDHNLRGPSGQLCRASLLRFVDKCSDKPTA